MLNNKKLFAAVNRIYYAIFYEALALLLTKGLSSSKHSGARSLFNREFVKSGIISEKHGSFYNRMYGFRQRGDYEDFVEFGYLSIFSFVIISASFRNFCSSSISFNW